MRSSFAVFLDALADLDAWHALRQQREADVLAHVHVRIEREELEDEGDVALAGAPHGDVLAAEQDLAAGRQFEPGDHAQRRRLAAARRPEHDEELAVLDGEVGILHRDELAEFLPQIFDPDLRHRLLRKLRDDDEHHRADQHGDERIGVERQREGLEQHEEADAR